MQCAHDDYVKEAGRCIGDSLDTIEYRLQSNTVDEHASHCQVGLAGKESSFDPTRVTVRG